jgi:hypothetical protein
VLGFSTKAYYKWRANPVCARDLDDAYLTNAAIDLHADDPEFGYRLIADDLRDVGHQVSGPPVHDDATSSPWSTSTAAPRTRSPRMRRTLCG